MNVVIMQPFYLFLRKHFHQVQRADVYFYMDDTQFVKNGHMNRNRIKGPNGYIWLTVPILQKDRFGQTLNQVEINNTENWRKKHWKTILQNYKRAPFFEKYSGFFEDVYTKEWNLLIDLNIYLIEQITSFLGIQNTKFKKLSELGIENRNPTQRLIEICENAGATRYIIGNRAKDYMDGSLWKKTKVILEYFEPEYPPYPQLWGDFLDNCAIIDILFNCGPEAGKYIWDSDNDR